MKKMLMINIALIIFFSVILFLVIVPLVVEKIVDNRTTPLKYECEKKNDYFECKLDFYINGKIIKLDMDSGVQSYIVCHSSMSNCITYIYKNLDCDGVNLLYQSKNNDYFDFMAQCRGLK